MRSDQPHSALPVLRAFGIHCVQRVRWVDDETYLEFTKPQSAGSSF
ncbi:hypothetical protein [Streptomyces sp. CB01881]|nr:hypothetical protein [Streptomyces sp. CB01881]